MVQAQGRIDAKLKQQAINTEQVTSNRVRRLINKTTEIKCITSTRRDNSGITVKLSVTCPTC